jgi:hypothetical protein
MSGARSRAGIFVLAYALLDDNSVEHDTTIHLEELLSWFRANLAIPTKFSRSSSKGVYRREGTPGISWFKPSAKSHLGKAHELKALLEINGHAIDILKTARPGYVVFEDEYQIVAHPFADDGWFE